MRTKVNWGAGMIARLAAAGAFLNIHVYYKRAPLITEELCNAS